MQRRGGKGRSRSTLHGFLADAINDKRCLLALLQELLHLLGGLHALVQQCLHLRLRTVGILNGKDACHTIIRIALESLYLALAFYYQSYCHTLHTTGRKSRLHLTPQYRRQLETYQAVEHTACLLGVHQIHIQTARRLDSLQNGRFGDFVEHDAVGFLLVQTEHFTQVP